MNRFANVAILGILATHGWWEIAMKFGALPLGDRQTIGAFGVIGVIALALVVVLDEQ